MQLGSLASRSTLGEFRWQVWTVDAHLVVTDPSALSDAYLIVNQTLADIEQAASRFRADSEIRRLASTGADGVLVSALLADLLRAALDAAADTDGDVDPTLGNALLHLGYTGDGAGPVRLTDVTRRQRISWRRVGLVGRRLWLPKGLLLDLGATAKAIAADLAAQKVAEALGIGVLVGLGGDLRVAGEQEPAGGWVILVQDGPDEPATSVRLAGAKAVATSSTLHRAWRQDGRRLHHILEPSTCQPAEAVWRTATVAAQTCLQANILTTACLVRGTRAPSLIAGARAPARLVAADGSVHLFGGFPA